MDWLLILLTILLVMSAAGFFWNGAAFLNRKEGGWLTLAFGLASAVVALIIFLMISA